MAASDRDSSSQSEVMEGLLYGSKEGLQPDSRLLVSFGVSRQIRQKLRHGLSILDETGHGASTGVNLAGALWVDVVIPG
jgi:hypothetical protein